MEFRQKGADAKNTEPGIPKIEVVPGDKGTINKIVVVVEDFLLLPVHSKESFVIEVIGV